MQALLVFFAVAGLSVLASNQRLLEAGRFFSLAQLAGSGLLFLALGAALGPFAAGLLSHADLERLSPLLSLGLTLGGLLIGLNLDLRVLRRLPSQVYAAAIAQAGVAYLFVAVPLTGLLLLATTLSGVGAIGAASLLGACAAVSSGHLAVVWHRAGRMDRASGLSVALLTMLDDLVGLFVLALSLAFGAASDPAEGALWVLFALALGAACGALLAYLAHGERGPELAAVVLGGVALVSGAAAWLKVSSLLVGLACGATLALVGGPSVELAWRALARLERPAYLVLVFLIGAHVNLTLPLAWALAPAFVALRFFGKLYGGALASRLTRGVLVLPPRVGYALIAQGAVSLCVLTEYRLLVPRDSTELIFAVGVVAVLANEVLASRAFRRALVPGAAAA